MSRKWKERRWSDGVDRPPPPDFKHDPQEDDPEIMKIIVQAGKEAEQHFKDEGFSMNWMGSCHFFWGEKKRILKKKYNIEWKCLREMNPEVLFD